MYAKGKRDSPRREGKKKPKLTIKEKRKKKKEKKSQPPDGAWAQR